MGIAEDVVEAVRAHPAVRDICLTGSRARGDATELSDWDYQVVADDFGSIARDLPCLVARFDPLAAQWDRLRDHECYLLVLDGPTKIDLIFADVSRSWYPPWRVGPDTLRGVDAHFWDWMLWLAGKRRRGKRDLVRVELHKMHEHLLAPMGVAVVPLTLGEAVERYRKARLHLERRYGEHIPRRLEEAVVPIVTAPFGDHYRPFDRAQ
ncbi:MAG: hypothetical protein JWL58_3351 [Streptosporangiaceae bacterium]|jgi:hypothetical protein|nr:hypothetical protein [Streptosporangiaceae bacterium]